MEYVEEIWMSPIAILKLINAGEGVSAARALIGLALHSSTLEPALEVVSPPIPPIRSFVEMRCSASVIWLAGLVSFRAIRYTT